MLAVHQGKLVYLPCGFDCDTFAGARPLTAPPQFLAVGRMVERASNLTLMAFARVLEQCPDARLRMIGEGKLWTLAAISPRRSASITQ